MITPIPEYIRTLQPYIPGKPIEETQREFHIKKVIKLASNENPLGPSPKALLALQKARSSLHRYPDSSAYQLKQRIVKHFGNSLAADRLIIGNGSNEVIDLLIRAFSIPGDQIVTSQAAFIAYKVSAQVHGVQTLAVSLDSEMNYDLSEMLTIIKREERVRLVFIANPNNPTGAYLKSGDLFSFLTELSKIRGGSVIVVLDYAYWEYVTAQDLPEPIALLKKFPNLVVLRTFSKIYGLAGLRVGYGIGEPEIISTLEKIRNPFNVNSMGMIAATSALGDLDFVKKSKTANEKGMKFWKKNLSELGVPYWESQGNFLLVDVKRGLGLSGNDVYQACLRKGVIFRPVSNYGLTQALRISIGTQSENETAFRVMREIR